MATAGDSPFPCPPASSFQTLVDDNDPRILYSGGWTNAGDPGFECEGTTHGAEGPNVTATLNFNGACSRLASSDCCSLIHISGVGVQVFGTVGTPDGSPSSTYQVDSLPASTFVFNANSQTNYHIPFYASPLLNAGNHTLVITSLGNNNSRIWLDYILYYPTTNELVSNSSEPSIPSTSTSSTSASSSATNTTHGASTNTVAIVGGVLGSVVGIILAIIFAYIILRWRRKHAYQSVAVTPFDHGLVANTAIPTHSVSASTASMPATWTNPISPVTTTSASQSNPIYAQEALMVSEYRSPPIYEP
ncbi:hypothetical protein BDP27DRAFT_1304648 [Rhodocollybia butyracea]|uniref:Uncharacterized protein n=1 Tax=Rhodocollybia butyracea TaxID=206335 RepID=A0A9P5P7N0_9AGAR|nr:hypothetical protein BDP27DRAFT_1304648 [Rhodocollybia butyracea]